MKEQVEQESKMNKIPIQTSAEKQSFPEKSKRVFDDIVHGITAGIGHIILYTGQQIMLMVSVISEVIMLYSGLWITFNFFVHQQLSDWFGAKIIDGSLVLAVMAIVALPEFLLIPSAMLAKDYIKDFLLIKDENGKKNAESAIWGLIFLASTIAFSIMTVVAVIEVTTKESFTTIRADSGWMIFRVISGYAYVLVSILYRDEMRKKGKNYSVEFSMKNAVGILEEKSGKFLNNENVKVEEFVENRKEEIPLLPEKSESKRGWLSSLFSRKQENEKDELENFPEIGKQESENIQESGKENFEKVENEISQEMENEKKEVESFPEVEKESGKQESNVLPFHFVENEKVERKGKSELESFLLSKEESFLEMLLTREGKREREEIAVNFSCVEKTVTNRIKALLRKEA